MPTIQKNDIRDFATQLYQEREQQIKQDFIDFVSSRLVQSIQEGEQYLTDGHPEPSLEDHFKKIDALKA